MLEDILQEIAAAKDANVKQSRIQRLVTHPDEVLDELIALCQQQKAPLVSIALQIIQAIGYPRNRRAFPVLFALAADRTSPVREEVFQVLVAMGPKILPDMIRFARENAQQNDLVFDVFASAGDFVFRTHRAEMEHILSSVRHELTVDPHNSMPALLYVLGTLKEWEDVAIDILEAIGYPDNAAAIPLVIAVASHYNNPAQAAAVGLLLQWGSDSVVPHLIEALWSQVKEGKTYYGAPLRDICDLVVHLDRAYVLPCGPSVSYLLSQASAEDAHNRRLLLTILEKVGKDAASYALPTLIALVSKEPSSDIIQQARRLIASFDEQALGPYQRLIASFSTYM